MNKKSTGLLLSILGVISLILITAGVTYAFFSYAKEGETVNTLSTGTITFYYDELNGTGNGINITEALPMTDEQGKALTGANNTFNFNITSTVSGKTNIPYTVTARMDKNSSLSPDQVKLYLENSSTTGTNYTIKEDETVKLFSELTATSVNVPNGVDERTIFIDTVPAESTSYTQNFTLKMWLNGEETTGTVDYSPYEFVLKTAVTDTNALDADDLIKNNQFITSTNYYALTEEEKANYERIAYVNMTDRTIYTVTQVTTNSFTEAPTGFEASEQFYQMNGQTFKVTVNVYANANVVQQGTGA